MPPYKTGSINGDLPKNGAPQRKLRGTGVSRYSLFMGHRFKKSALVVYDVDHIGEDSTIGITDTIRCEADFEG